MSTDAPAPAKLHPILKLCLEVGPVAVFFLSYRWFKDNPLELFGATYEGVTAATVVFVPAILLSLAVSWIMARDLPKMALVTAAVVVVFGGLTLWLNDATFIKMKPTIVNGLFALALGFGLARGRSYLQYLMADALDLTDEGWRVLTLRFVALFTVMALVNELVWRTQSEDFWVNFKTFASPAITFVFMLAQAPLLKRHGPGEDGAA